MAANPETGVAGPANADQVAAAIEILAMGSDEPLKALAVECGLSKSVAQRLAQRIRSRHGAVVEAVKQRSTRDFVEKLEEKAWAALEMIDDFTLSCSSAKDLAIIVGIMLEKRQLLSGQPTAILSFEERRNMDELMPLLVKEAQRRGMIVDGHAHEIGGEPIMRVIEPVDTQDAALSATARRSRLKMPEVPEGG